MMRKLSLITSRHSRKRHATENMFGICINRFKIFAIRTNSTLNKEIAITQKVLMVNFKAEKGNLNAENIQTSIMEYVNRSGQVPYDLETVLMIIYFHLIRKKEQIVILDHQVRSQSRILETSMSSPS